MARVLAEQKLFAAVYSVATVLNSGLAANCVDIAIMGDGYRSIDLAGYRTKVASFTNMILDYSPLDEYKNYFNVHRIDVASVSSGVDNDPTQGISRNTALNSYYYSYYWCGGTQRLICTDVTKVGLVARAAPGYDQKLVLIKSNTWGGAG
ncbi:MAG: hypothetical protein IT292_11740 [Deltaproteobacteria bacterium]|nr:hypothetical protein [Deltaproteobacteria bacterium]